MSTPAQRLVDALLTASTSGGLLLLHIGQDEALELARTVHEGDRAVARDDEEPAVESPAPQDIHEFPDEL